MRTFVSLEELAAHGVDRATDFRDGSAVAIGKFDGVHLGHQSIMDSVRRTAQERGLRTVVFTFANNPLSFLRPETCPKPISSVDQRLEQLELAGIEFCVMVDFNADFAAIPARDFVEQHLVGELNMKHVILGSDFRFGHGGAGDAALLRELGEELGFTVEVVENVTSDAATPVSSTRIREAVLAGDVAAASEMLGRPYAVRGTVVHGDARGRELGFPTANLGPSIGGAVEGLIPADGVYAGSVVIDGEEHVAAISVGVNLTFDPDGEPRVEAFVLDFSGDLYGKTMEVRFDRRIRPMVAFTGVDALIARMQQDVDETREAFAQNPRF